MKTVEMARIFGVDGSKIPSDCLPSRLNRPRPGNEAEFRRLLGSAGDCIGSLALNLMAEREYEAGNLEGCAHLCHAMDYLSDRERYLADPPPTPDSLRFIGEIQGGIQ